MFVVEVVSDCQRPGLITACDCAAGLKEIAVRVAKAQNIETRIVVVLMIFLSVLPGPDATETNTSAAAPTTAI
jgi:hypothetical protein